MTMILSGNNNDHDHDHGDDRDNESRVSVRKSCTIARGPLIFTQQLSNKAEVQGHDVWRSCMEA
eukprot:6812862-Lingulodinium_polyedra.AAC.1